MNDKPTQTPTFKPRRTITIEEIGEVPELARAWRIDDYDACIIERLNGAFVRRHDNPLINMIWDDARFIAERLEARYIGPGRPEFWPARKVQEGWYVLVGSPTNQRWERVKAVTEVVNLAKMRQTGQLRPKIRIEFNHRLPVTFAPNERIDCRRAGESA